MLLTEDGGAHLARAGRLHPVPDAETLALLPRHRVAAVRAPDLHLLAGVVGEPLPSVRDASAEARAIDACLRTLAPLPYEDEKDEHGPSSSVRASPRSTACRWR